MTDNKVESQTNRKGINPVMAAMAGAVVAGAAVAGAIIMSDKKNQDKIKNVVSNVKTDVENKKKTVVVKAHKLENIAKDTVNKIKNI